MISRQSAAINSARAVLALGVIVYHSARIFDPFPYYLKAPEQSESLAPLILLGAIWAMPLFFFVAGFALWHSLESRGTGNYIRDRVKRLLLPLTVGLLTLIPFQIYLSRLASGEQISFLTSMRQYLDVHFTFDLPFPIRGLWFDYSHLWFIAYLFSFSLLLLPLVLWLRRRPSLPNISPAGGVVVWIATIITVATLEALIGIDTSGAWERWSFLIFMALGVLLACQPNFSAVLGKHVNLLAAGAFAGFFGLVGSAGMINYDINSLSHSNEVSFVLWRAGKGIVGVLFVMAIVGSVVNHRPSPETGRRRGPVAAFMGYVGPISLPLYLLHLTLVITIAYFVLQVPAPAAVQFLVIVLLTIFTSIAIIEGAKRSRLGCLLLGMKYKTRAQTVRPAPRVPDPGQVSEPSRTPHALVS